MSDKNIEALKRIAYVKAGSTYMIIYETDYTNEQRLPLGPVSLEDIIQYGIDITEDPSGLLDVLKGRNSESE